MEIQESSIASTLTAINSQIGDLESEIQMLKEMRSEIETHYVTKKHLDSA